MSDIPLPGWRSTAYLNCLLRKHKLLAFDSITETLSSDRIPCDLHCKSHDFNIPWHRTQSPHSVLWQDREAIAIYCWPPRSNQDTAFKLNWDVLLCDFTLNSITWKRFSDPHKCKNRAFHIMEKTRTAGKCTKIKNAFAKHAKPLVFIVKCANLWCFCCHWPLGCLKELSQIVLPHFGMLKNNDEVCLLKTK